MFTPEQIELLSAPLDRSHVKSRAQAGRQLSYIEGWTVIAEANRIFGFGAWDRETVELRQLGEPYQTPQVERDGRPKLINGEPIMNWRVGYMAKVRVTVNGPVLDGRWTSVFRDGCGFGSGIDRDLGQAHESALKEAETDAMKRALMTFGNPFGLALYDKTQANVADAEAPSAPAQRQAAARAIPAEVARSPDAPPGIERKMAGDLIARMRLMENERALDTFINDRNNIKTFNDLPEDLQDTVANAIASHRESLKSKVAA